MNDLPEFLLARIAEDEAEARRAAKDEGGRWLVDGPASLAASFGERGDSMGAWSALTTLRRDSIADHIARWDPAHVLAECEAKRRLVTFADEVVGPMDLQIQGEWGSGPILPENDERLRMLRILALPYADHADYRQEWRP